MYTHYHHYEPVASRTISFIILFFIISMVYTGCTVGPRFVKPQIPVQTVWNNQDSSLVVSQTAPDSTWWTIFNDSVLNQLIILARKQNLSLQTAGIRILEARAQLAIAVGKQFPQTQTVIGNLMAIGVSRNIADAIGIDRNFWNYQVGFDISWEVDFWGKFRREIQAQTASLHASRADYDNALVSLIAEVAQTYILIKTYEVLIDLANTNAALQEDGLKIAQVRYRNGATSELDVIQASTILASTRASIPQLEISLSQYKNALGTLLGGASDTIDSLIRGPREIPSVSSPVQIIVPSELLKRRPDIRNAEHLAEAQNALIGAVKSELYPHFVISGLLGTQSSSGTGVPSNNLFSAGSYFYAAGPRIQWPIFNYGRISNNVRVQDARLQQLLLDYQNTVLRAVREVQDGIDGYLNSRESEAFTDSATKGALRSVDLALVQYRDGAVDYQRVLGAYQSLLDNQNSLARTRSTIATNLISLYKATGGGWNFGTGEPVVPDSTRIQMQHRTNWGNLLSTPLTPSSIDVSTPKDSDEP